MKSDWLHRRCVWRVSVTIVLITLVITISLWSLFTGIADVTPRRLFNHLVGAHGPDSLTHMQWISFSQIRLLRVVLATLAGYLLSTAGALMQCITGNPMASPFTTGISNAATFGASIAILTQLRIAGSWTTGTITLAFCSALACSALVFGMASLKSLSRNAIILMGIALSYLFGAAQSGLQFVANEQNLTSIVNWAFGDLTRATWPQVCVLAVLGTICLAHVHAFSASYAKLDLGDETATAMGVRVRALRLSTGALVTLTTACVVALTGVIGFVGLVGPHLARLLVGGNRYWQLPLAGILGALLLVSADLLGRTIVSPVEVPVGIVISFIGVPLFVWMIISNHGSKL